VTKRSDSNVQYSVLRYGHSELGPPNDLPSSGTLSLGHPVTRSPCHPVTLSPCHPVTLSWLLALLLVGYCGFLFFYGLGRRDLWSSHEARAAQDAQSILSDGGWTLPRLFDRSPELQKPPLYYWLVAGIAWLNGRPVDGWAVRLPSALAGLGCVLLLLAFGILRGRTLAGFLAAAFLATFLHFTWMARVGRTDMPLAFLVSLAMLAFYLALRLRLENSAWAGWPWCLVGYLAVALAVLLKGPIGFVLPAAALVCLYYLERRFTRIALGPRLVGSALGLWWGLPLVVLLVAPWFVWADAATHGAFFRVFFWKHNLERGLGSGDLQTHPWWFYGPRLGFDLLPWSPLLIPALWLLFRRRMWPQDAEARFGLVWLATLVLLLSLAKFKRADYLLPAYPGAALLLGTVGERVVDWMRRPLLGAAILGAALAAIGIGWWIRIDQVLPRQEAQQECRRFAAEIRRRAPAPQLILFFRAEAHLLAFHVGQPIDTLLEWENLDIWAARPEVYYVVMPPEYVAEWPRHLKNGQLQEVLRNTDLSGGTHARPLVLLCTKPITE
jgi:4-amino-4-deoxy-L-arabinose transferase-like glycosyltransferase